MFFDLFRFLCVEGLDDQIDDKECGWWQKQQVVWYILVIVVYGFQNGYVKEVIRIKEFVDYVNQYQDQVIVQIVVYIVDEIVDWWVFYGESFGVVYYDIVGDDEVDEN